MSLTLRRFAPADAEAVTALLHRAYGDLAARGLNFTAATQDAAVTARRAAGGASWVLADGALPVATLTLSVPPSASVRRLTAEAAVPGRAWLNQLAVDPEHQGRGHARVRPARRGPVAGQDLPERGARPRPAARPGSTVLSDGRHRHGSTSRVMPTTSPVVNPAARSSAPPSRVANTGHERGRGRAGRDPLEHPVQQRATDAPRLVVRTHGDVLHRDVRHAVADHAGRPDHRAAVQGDHPSVDPASEAGRHGQPHACSQPTPSARRRCASAVGRRSSRATVPVMGPSSRSRPRGGVPPDRPTASVDGMARPTSAAVAASSRWTDPDGVRMPAGEVHAWVPGHNETLCGLSLHRSSLLRFAHVRWADVQPESGKDADAVGRVCPRCAAGMGRRRDEKPWRRVDPRP
jgi:hypothetical protein